jgi:transposase
MEYWAQAPQLRGQMVLFASRLDEVLAAGHPVRMLDEILSRLDWSAWEAGYDLTKGQPPIHPRVLASVILYGLLTRIRSSRALEEALSVRLDFRWLVEGRTIDHTTLSTFRKQHPEALQTLFVQIGLVARELGHVTLSQLAFDGTQMRANSRRSGTRKVADLAEARAALAAKSAELQAKAEAQDTVDQDAERLVGQANADRLDAATIAKQMAQMQRQMSAIDAALAEIERVKAAGETVPKHIPLTDPEARVTPNKDGGFAPNFTPLATVDVASGLIVACDVIAMTNEEHHLVSQVEAVQANFGLAQPPSEVLADTRSLTGINLHALQERGVTLFAPSQQADLATNPARRDDLAQPVPEDQRDRLPTKTTKHKDGTQTTQLTKDAFVYDEANDCYWCPHGQRLKPRTTTQEKQVGGTLTCTRYAAPASACASCPLRAKCLSAKADHREISRYQHDDLIEAHSQRMATPEAKQKYAARMHRGERPFAHIKHHLGARQFLLRGLKKVRLEWTWLVSAFNLRTLLTLLQPRPGPEPETITATP